jgi:hypothetical protein
VGSFETSAFPCGVAVSGSYAYVADANAGLRIIDVSTISSPVEVGFYDTGGSAWSVTVSGSYDYVADGEDGIYIIQNDLLVGISEESNLYPSSFLLAQNYPNPFNPSTKIKYSISQSSNVVIKVFDMLGNEIETLVDEEKQTGTYEVTWYAEKLTSGVYFYQLKAVDPKTSSGQVFVETKKMVLLR